MSASTKSPTSRAIVNTVRAALKLLSSSSEQLSVSQLLALKSDMREARVVVNDQMKVKQSNNQKTVLEISDWHDSDEDENDDESSPGTAEPEEGMGSLPIPGPYPLSPPTMDELPEYWYVVDRGTEVGILADNASSTNAVAGVPCGHQIKLKSWYEAATLYNSLLSKGLIVRVRA